MYDVLCTGLTCCDLIFPGLEAFPVPGREMASRDFLIKPGGAANTPVALAKLGMKTIFATVIGNDYLGRVVFELLEKTGIDMSAIGYGSQYRTNVSAVLSIGNERCFATYFANNDDTMQIRQIEKYAPECRHIHTYIHDCLSMPLMEIAKRNNRTVSLDTAWDESIRLEDIKDIISGCDIFLTNEVEACSITGAGTAEEAMDRLGKYAGIVAVKLGGKGSIVKSGERVIRVPAIEEVEVLDTTGAGDLYGAGFVYGFLNGWDLEKTARFASASGSLAVTFYGGINDAYSKERVMQFFSLIKK